MKDIWETATGVLVKTIGEHETGEYFGGFPYIVSLSFYVVCMFKHYTFLSLS